MLNVGDKIKVNKVSFYGKDLKEKILKGIHTVVETRHAGHCEIVIDGYCLVLSKFTGDDWEVVKDIKEQLKDNLIKSQRELLEQYEKNIKKIERLIGGYLAGRDISANDLIMEILEIVEEY